MWADLSESWRVCLELSWESFCEGSIPIAAVITDSGGSILSRGRNRISGHTSTSRQEIVGGPLAHAEINALLDLDLSTVNTHQLKLYTTVEPCPLCIGAICMAGIKQIQFAARDVWAGSTNLLHASPYLRYKKISAHGPAYGKLEALVHMLQVACSFHRQHPRVTELLAAWSRENPRNVDLGECLHQSGELEQLRQRGVPIEAVVLRLTELMKI